MPFLFQCITAVKPKSAILMLSHWFINVLIFLKYVNCFRLLWIPWKHIQIIIVLYTNMSICVNHVNSKLNRMEWIEGITKNLNRSRHCWIESNLEILVIPRPSLIMSDGCFPKSINSDNSHLEAHFLSYTMVTYERNTYEINFLVI